jgi:hypothetical protein
VPDLMLVFEVLLGLVLLRLYTLVPMLGPTMVLLRFPGTPEQATAAVGFVQRHQNEAWVAQVSIGAMAAEVGELGLWALTRPQWTQAFTWPLWLPGSVRGTVRGAIEVRRVRLAASGRS